MANDDKRGVVTREEALAFADEAFRNRDITFSGRDVVDITAALGTFLARRLTCKQDDRMRQMAINLKARQFCDAVGIGWENTAVEYRERYRAAAAAFLGLTLETAPTRQAKTGDALTPEPDRFRKFIERIAAWTDEEVTVVDARQIRHVARVVIAGADPIYPPFGPSAVGWAFVAPSSGGAA